MKLKLAKFFSLTLFSLSFCWKDLKPLQNLSVIKYKLIQFQILSLGLDVESEYSMEGNFQFTFWILEKKENELASFSLHFLISLPLRHLKAIFVSFF